MADREDSTVPIRTQAEALDGIRAVRRDVKDLLPCQCGFHRPLELPRCDRRQNGIGIDPELGPETATDEGTDQSHVLDRNLQGLGDHLLSLVQHLVCGVEDELVALPHRQRGMGLHHGVTLQWGGVGRVNLHRGAGEGAREIAHRAVGRRRIIRVWNARRTEIAA